MGWFTAPPPPPRDKGKNIPSEVRLTGPGFSVFLKSFPIVVLYYQQLGDHCKVIVSDLPLITTVLILDGNSEHGRTHEIDGEKKSDL